MPGKDILKMLNIDYPIISAPMAGAAGGLLATEVTKAGGLGLIGAGYGHRQWVEREINIAEAGHFGVGFITWRLADNPELLTFVLNKKPRAIMLSFGDITPFVDIIKSAGVPLICQVQTVGQAIDCKQKGADIIIAQGTEAGGHGASLSAMSLVPAVVDSVGDIPVVAAGGICDPRGMHAAFSLGAQGILMGTRFLASRESLISEALKQHILTAKGSDTIRSNVFDFLRGYHWPEPYTGRTLRNKATDRWQDIEDMASQVTPEMMDAYQKAVDENNFEEAGVFVGEGVDLITEILSAQQIVETFVETLG